MKADIHPKYSEIKVVCSCGNEFTTGSLSVSSCTWKFAPPATPFYGQAEDHGYRRAVDKFRN